MSLILQQQKAQNGCPDSPRPYTGGPNSQDIFRSLFVFVQKVKKEKKKILYLFLFNWGEVSQASVLNLVMMNTTVQQSYLSISNFKF